MDKWLLLCVFLGLVSRCESNTAAVVSDLYTKLFVTDAYNFRIRPVLDQTSGVVVYISMTLLSMNGLDEISETLTTTAYLEVVWTDELLRWTLTDYNINNQQWPQNEVWKPDISLQNSNQPYAELGIPSQMVDSYYTGYIYWYPFEVFESTCSIDITYYPFDVQTCALEFTVWSYVVGQVNLEKFPNGTEIDLSSFTENPEWEVIATSQIITSKASTTLSIFEIKLKRRPMHVLLSIVVPIIMLALLNVCVFLLPSDDCRAGYCMTVFLSFAIFLTIVSSTLPANSQSVSVFSLFLIIQTITSVTITIIVLVMVRYYYSKEPVAGWVISLLRFENKLRCKCRSKKSRVHDSGKGTMELTEAQSIDEAFQDDDDTRTTFSEKDLTWKEAIDRLDRILFIFFLIVVFCVTVVCFTYASAKASV